MKNRLSTITALLGVIAFLLFIIVVQNLTSSLDIQVRHHNQKMDHGFMMGDRSDPDRPSFTTPGPTARICMLSMGDSQLVYADDSTSDAAPSIYPPLDNGKCIDMGTITDDTTVTNIDPNIEPMPLVAPKGSALDSTSTGSAAGTVATSGSYTPRPGMRLRM